MNEIRQSLKAWRASGSHNKQAICDAAWGIVQKYALEIANTGGVAPASLNRRRRRRGWRRAAHRSLGLPTRRRCLGAAPCSPIFAVRTLDDSVTGAWGDYAGGFNDAFNNSTPDAVASAAYAVVDQAAANGIDEADLEVLGGMADARPRPRPSGTRRNRGAVLTTAAVVETQCRFFCRREVLGESSDGLTSGVCYRAVRHP